MFTHIFLCIHVNTYTPCTFESSQSCNTFAFELSSIRTREQHQLLCMAVHACDTCKGTFFLSRTPSHTLLCIMAVHLYISTRLPRAYLDRHDQNGSTQIYWKINSCLHQFIDKNSCKELYAGGCGAADRQHGQSHPIKSSHRLFVATSPCPPYTVCHAQIVRDSIICITLDETLFSVPIHWIAATPSRAALLWMKWCVRGVSRVCGTNNRLCSWKW